MPYLSFISGRQDALKKVAILQKICVIFSIFGNLLVPELIIKGWEGLIPANLEELFIGTVKWHKLWNCVVNNQRYVSFTDKGSV